MMPVLDGFGVLRALRSEPGLGQLRVIVMSADDLCSIELSRPAHVRSLGKPFRVRELVERFHGLM
jgi:CheY-like chemotaxis protein